MGNISCMNDWAEKVWPTWHGCHIGRSEKDQPSNFYSFSGEPQILKKWKLFCFAWMKSLTRCEQVSSIFKACGSWKSENRFFCMKEKMDKVWEPKLQSNGLLLLLHGSRLLKNARPLRFAVGENPGICSEAVLAFWWKRTWEPKSGRLISRLCWLKSG